MAYRWKTVPEYGTYKFKDGRIDFPAVAAVLETDTANGVAGTYHEATVAEVQDGVMFGPASAYAGELAAAEQTAKPGEWSLEDSGDGQHRTLTVAGTWEAGTEFALFGVSSLGWRGTCIYPGNMKVSSLSAGETHQLYATEPGKTQSEPSDDEHVGGAIVANFSAGAENILLGEGDRVDGAETAGAYIKPRYVQSGGAAVGTTLITQALAGQTINLSQWTITADADIDGVTVHAYLYQIIAGVPTLVDDEGGAAVDFTAAVPVDLATALSAPEIEVDDYGVGEFVIVVTITDTISVTEYQFSGYDVPDFPEVSNVVPPDTVNGAVGTFAGGGSQPTAPSFSSAAPTAASGQVTVHITAVNPTDVIYVLSRSGSGGWSAESETFKRTGSGDVAMTGLTDETGYEFVAYAKAGSITSEYSDPCFATPTAGTTPAGLASLPLKYLEDTLAASAAFQGWVGVANAEAAKERIHPVTVATAEALVTVTAGVVSAVELIEPGCGYSEAPTVTVRGAGSGASITAAVSGGRVTGFTIVDGGSGYTAGRTLAVVDGPPMPWALIDWAENFQRQATAGGSRRYFEQSGDLICVLRAPVDADHDDEEAAIAFLNVVGEIIEDIEELAGTAGYLSVNSIARAQGPRRPEAAEVQTAGDFYEIWLRFGWDGL